MKKFFFSGPFFFLCIANVVILMKCTPGISGVETTNGFTITATTDAIEGTAPAFSTVYLFDTAYIPYIDSGFGYGTAVTAEKDFRFPLSSGSYNIFVYSYSGDLGGTAQKVALADAAESRQKTMDKTTSISGFVTMPENTSALVYIPGSDFYRLLKESGPFTLTGIPAGTFRIKVARLSGTLSQLTVLHSVKVDVSANTAHDCGTFTIE